MVLNQTHAESAEMTASQLSGGDAPQPKYIAVFINRMKRYNSSNSEAAERHELVRRRKILTRFLTEAELAGAGEAIFRRGSNRHGQNRKFGD